VASSSGATSIAFRKANLKLEVTPQITPEGNIILDLDVTKDTVGQSTPAGFAIDTKHIKTRYFIKNKHLNHVLIMLFIFTNKIINRFQIYKAFRKKN
jgi:type II secretory pathway component GspD/PulD (secretin)